MTFHRLAPGGARMLERVQQHPPPRNRLRRITRRVTVCAILGGAVACGTDKIATVTPPDIASLYWSLSNEVPAATVVVGGTQQLHVTPRTKSGDPIASVVTPTWSSGDSTKVTVDANGVVTGVAITDGVPVVASLTLDQITYVDTTIVAVTATATTMDSLRIVIPPGGPVVGLASGIIPLSAEALDADGNVIPGVAVSIVSTNTDRLQVFSYGGPLSAQGASLGPVWVVAKSTAYGVTKTDSVQFIVQYGMQAFLSTNTTYLCNPICGYTTMISQSAVVIGVGGSVSFANYVSTGSLDVVFDSGADQVTGGNIAGISPYSQESRQFPVAGTYPFHSVNLKVSGTVFVREQPTY